MFSLIKVFLVCTCCKVIFVEPASGERDIEQVYNFISVYAFALCIRVCVVHLFIFFWAITCTFVHLCMDFKIIWHSCWPQGVEVPFKHLFR